MTIEELQRQLDENNRKLEQYISEIEREEPECLEEYETLSEPEHTAATSSSVTSAPSSGNFKLSGGIKTTYQNGETFEYNGIVYTYNSDYGAFVRTKEPLCTKDNISQYMVPKSILETIHANVIVEFTKERIRNDGDLTNTFETSYKDNKFFGTSKNGELPVTRIYNINHNVNKVQFELNQYWAGENSQLGGTIGDNKYNTCINGCLAFSFINSLNSYDAQENYDSGKIYQFLDNNVTQVLSQFNGENQNVVINNAKNIPIITASANIPMGKSYGYGLEENGTYVARSFKTGNGKIRTTGAHYVLLVPSGDGKCYVVDSNNSLIRSTEKDKPYYVPYMTYQEAEKSLEQINGAKAWEVVRKEES